MRKKIATVILAAFVAVVLTPHFSNTAHAGETGVYEPEGPLHWFGSGFLTVLNVPYRLASCIVWQATAVPMYVMTSGVQGGYTENEVDGASTRDIGEVASGSCAGPWVVSPQDLAQDYAYDEYE